MLERLLQELTSAASSTFSKYAARAVAALPLVIAGGFATAALTLMLVERFGASLAYMLLATAFASLGVLLVVVTTAGDSGRALPFSTPHALTRASGLLNMLLAALVAMGIALYAIGMGGHPSTAERTVLARPAVAK